MPRETLAATLWPDAPPGRLLNALHTTLSRLGQTLAAATDDRLSEITVACETRYQLDPDLVDVDYWHFTAALADRRATTD